MSEADDEDASRNLNLNLEQVNPDRAPNVRGASQKQDERR